MVSGSSGHEGFDAEMEDLSGDQGEALVDIGKLKQAILACEQAVGSEAEPTQALRAQLASEMLQIKKLVPPHQLLLRVERRIQACSRKADKLAKRLEESHKE